MPLIASQLSIIARWIRRGWLDNVGHNRGSHPSARTTMSNFLKLTASLGELSNYRQLQRNFDDSDGEVWDEPDDLQELQCPPFHEPPPQLPPSSKRRCCRKTPAINTAYRERALIEWRAYRVAKRKWSGDKKAYGAAVKAARREALNL